MNPSKRFKADDGSQFPDWDEQDFYEVFVIKQNNTFSRDMLNYDKGDVQNIHYGDVLIKFGSFIDCEVDVIPNINVDIPIDKYAMESYVQDGDIILADTAEDYTAGKVSEIYRVGNKKILSGLHTMLCRPQIKFASKYLGYYMNSEEYHKQIVRLLVGTKVYSINRNAIGKTHIKFPCFEEQKKIADFLSDIDHMISIQEQQLATLEEQKVGMMQKIFSQEVRFKDDSGNKYPEWNEQDFYDVFAIKQNNTFSRDMLNYDNGKVQNIHYGDVLIKYGSFIDCEADVIPNINNDIPIDKYDIESYVQDGDIILADTAEDYTAGKVSEIYHVGDKKILSGLHTMLCRPQIKFASKYLGYYMNSEEYHKQIVRLLVGTKVYSINRNAIGRTQIKFPCKNEQEKIANFLSNYDKAIKIKKNKIEAWETLKKGLIQQMFV